jgi:large subunit ribosomal protein L10
MGVNTVATMKLSDKQAIVTEMAEVAANSVSAVAAFYSGLTVEQMTDLRSKARKSDVYLRVVRNTLARKAVENTEFSCLTEKLVGPVILAFASKEPNAAARVMRDFAKENNKLKVVGLALGGKLFGVDQLEAIAKLPTYEEAISMLMSVIQAPVSKLVRTMAATNTKLVRTIAAVRDQKQAA